MLKSVKLHPESLWSPTVSPSPALIAGIYQVYCHHPQTGLVGGNNGNSLSAWRGHWENDFLTEGKQTTYSIRSTTDYAELCFLDSEEKSTLCVDTICTLQFHDKSKKISTLNQVSAEWQLLSTWEIEFSVFAVKNRQSRTTEHFLTMLVTDHGWKRHIKTASRADGSDSPWIHTLLSFLLHLQIS